MSSRKAAMVAGSVWYQPQPQRSARGENSNQKPGSPCCLARRKVSHITSLYMGSPGPRRVSRQMREMLLPTLGTQTMFGSISASAGVRALTSSASGSTTRRSYSPWCSWNHSRESISLFRTRNSRVSSVKGKIHASSRLALYHIRGAVRNILRRAPVCRDTTFFALYLWGEV